MGGESWPWLFHTAGGKVIQDVVSNERGTSATGCIRPSSGSPNVILQSTNLSQHRGQATFLQANGWMDRGLIAIYANTRETAQRLVDLCSVIEQSWGPSSGSGLLLFVFSGVTWELICCNFRE